MGDPCVEYGDRELKPKRNGRGRHKAIAPSPPPFQEITVLLDRRRIIHDFSSPAESPVSDLSFLPPRQSGNIFVPPVAFSPGSSYSTTKPYIRKVKESMVRQQSFFWKRWNNSVAPGLRFSPDLSSRNHIRTDTGCTLSEGVIEWGGGEYKGNPISRPVLILPLPCWHTQ